MKNSSVLEVMETSDGGTEVRLRLFGDEEGLLTDEQEAINSAVLLLIEGANLLGVRLAAFDSRALVVRSAISQWIKSPRKISVNT